MRFWFNKCPTQRGKTVFRGKKKVSEVPKNGWFIKEEVIGTRFIKTVYWHQRFI